MTTLHIKGNTKQVYVTIDKVRIVSVNSKITIITFNEHKTFTTVLDTLEDTTISCIVPLTINIDISKYLLYIY